MRKKAARKPRTRRLKKQLTIRLDTEAIDYFQGLSRELALPYQSLMNMYLRDCAASRRRPQWTTPVGGARLDKRLAATTTLPRAARR